MRSCRISTTHAVLRCLYVTTLCGEGPAGQCCATHLHSLPLIPLLPPPFIRPVCGLRGFGRVAFISKSARVEKRQRIILYVAVSIEALSVHRARNERIRRQESPQLR